jgi:transcriptional regulator with XRE-family HTH domain
MKTITEIRLENFKKIAATYKTQREFSDVLGESTGYINQLLHGKRGIGEKVARKFEEKLRMSHLSLDVDSIQTSLNDSELKSPVEAIEVTPEELGYINLLRDLASTQRKVIIDAAKELKSSNQKVFLELSNRYNSHVHA